MLITIVDYHEEENITREAGAFPLNSLRLPSGPMACVHLSDWQTLR